MADATFPVKVQLEVKGAVLAYPGDCIVIATSFHPTTDAEHAELSDIGQRLTDFIGIQVVIVDSVTELAVVRKQPAEFAGLLNPPGIQPEHEPGKCTWPPIPNENVCIHGIAATPEAAHVWKKHRIPPHEMKHDLTMVHKFSGEEIEQCPPNCPANPLSKLPDASIPAGTLQFGIKRNAEGELEWTDNPEDRDHEQLIQREPQTSMQDQPVPPLTFGKMTSKAQAALGDICRRCFRKKGDTTRKPCGDCPDFADAAVPAEIQAATLVGQAAAHSERPLASDEALAALRAKLSGEEVQHAHETAQEGAAAASGNSDAGWPDPASFSKSGDTIAQPGTVSYYDLGNGPLG